jgi:hypothetical protein
MQINMPSRRSDVLVTEFLRDSLAGGALGVTQLEVMARAVRLLGERQRIAHAKVFKRAKDTPRFGEFQSEFVAFSIPQLIFLRRHDLYPSTESFENSPGYHNAKVPSGRLLDVG